MRKTKNDSQPVVSLMCSKKQRWMKTLFLTLTFLICFSIGALASSGSADPVATINNMSDFIFDAIRAIGMILMGMGVVQIGMVRPARAE